MALNYSQLQLQLPLLQKQLLGKHISKIILLAKNVYSFSISKTENVILSFKNSFPFITVTSFQENYSSLPDAHVQYLKKEISNSLIQDISLLNNNRIFKFTLKTINEIFKEEIKYLICEVIPNKANLFLLDSNSKIKFLLKNSSKNVNFHTGLIYEEPQANEFKLKQATELPSLDNQINLTLLDRKKEKFKDLFNTIERRFKVSKHKIENINQDILNAKNHLNDGEIGNLILMNLSSIHPKDKSIFIDDFEIKLDPRLKPSENANMYFKKARKAKTTLEQSKVNLEKAIKENKQAEKILNSFNELTEAECEELIKEFEIKEKSKNSDNHLISNAVNPYSFTYNGYTVLFGKNAKQNDYLTFFEDTSKNHIWMHIIGYSGSHLMIKDSNPPDELIKLCSELLCYASKQVDGQVMLTKRENVKKGNVPGQVEVKTYKTIRVNSVSKKVIEIFENSKKI